MTQPLNREARCETLGELDTEAGEFWMENPWLVGDHNVSAYERNRVLLNGRDRTFVDVSHLTGADVDSDSRAAVTGDLNQDGMPDLIVRSSGGGPLRIFLNRFPPRRWLKITLQGELSNRRGIGAKLKFEAGQQTIWRDLYPVSSFYSQEASFLHVGLGEATQVDRLTIWWPSGSVQILEDVSIDRHVLIRENESMVQSYPAVAESSE